ncbi:MAG: response regulator [Phycisphaerae bacterium]
MSTKRILVVEDDRKSLYALTAVLEQLGHQVKGYAEPAQVSIPASEFDAAIIDLRLPDTPGALFADKLRQQNPNIRIVFVTAYAAADGGGDLRDAPLLVKPLNVDEVLSLI